MNIIEFLTNNYVNGVVDIANFLKWVFSQIGSFISFATRLPQLIRDLYVFIPDPLYIVANAFISVIIVVILLKVVRLIVG